MNGPDILIPAIVAFVLMAIGLALTIREFRHLETRPERPQKPKVSDAGVRAR